VDGGADDPVPVGTGGGAAGGVLPGIGKFTTGAPAGNDGTTGVTGAVPGIGTGGAGADAALAIDGSDTNTTDTASAAQIAVRAARPVTRDEAIPMFPDLDQTEPAECGRTPASNCRDWTMSQTTSARLANFLTLQPIPTRSDNSA